MSTTDQHDDQPQQAGRRKGRGRRIAATLALTGALAAAAPQAAAAADGTACQDADATAQQVGVATVQAATLCLLRAERAKRGLPALRRDDRLTRAGSQQASAMVREGFFGHIGPDGSTLSRRLDAVGFIPDAGRWWAGEILAEGTKQEGSAAGLMRSWLASPAHKAILVDPTFNRVGVGVKAGTSDDPADPGATSAAVFGKRVSR